MVNRKILFILFISIQLVFSLKSDYLCRLEQIVCKGFYDSKQQYKTKCKLVDCSSSFSTKCGINTCSRNRTECQEYKKFNSYVHTWIGKQAALNPKMTDMYLKERATLHAFNKDIKACKKRMYKLESNDFCLNGFVCAEKLSLSFGYTLIKKKIDCKCPNKNSYKCGIYCTKDSIACDYIKKIKQNQHFISSIKMQ